MKNSKILLFFLLIVLLFVGCSNVNDNAKNSAAGSEIILATTTSTENSGLLDYILPKFTEKTGIKTKVVAVGTGKALEMGKNGETDVLLVHAKASEEQFVLEGYGVERFDVMYNDFIIIGPESDPAMIKGLNVVEALTEINNKKVTFVSRGDDSGTHKKEIFLWQLAQILPEGDWYVSVGKGMGDTISITNEMLGYTMTDRATFLSMKENIELTILVEGDDVLFNQYGVIIVNPEKNENINSVGAKAFVNWILSDETQKLIGTYKKYDEVLFIPNAK